MKVTPTQIKSLNPNEVFVFGSNLDGNHAGGAARFAVMKFGAKNGQNEGLQGQSYAIPTLTHPGGLPNHKLPLKVIGDYVDNFLYFAYEHPNMFFYVTPIGCGIAGFKESEIAPLFAECLQMDNVALPQSFIDKIQIKELNENNMNKKKEIEDSWKEIDNNYRHSDEYPTIGSSWPHENMSQIRKDFNTLGAITDDDDEFNEGELSMFAQDGDEYATHPFWASRKPLHEKTKKIIRLTESDLHNIIKESVKNILKNKLH